MHQTFLLGNVVWTFLILFSFTWILLFIRQPEFVKSEDTFSNTKAAWYSFGIAILIALLLWLLHFIVNWRQTRRDINLIMDNLSRSDKAKYKKDTKAFERQYRRSPGRSPLEKLQNMLK